MKKGKLDREHWDNVEDWDGTPNNWLPDEYVQTMYDSVPHFHGCAYGPVPFGSTDPIHLVVDNVVCKTAEEAHETLVGFIKAMCELWRTEYDEDDWDIQHIVLVNGN